MLNSFSRTELLLGHPAMEALKHARVAVFGTHYEFFPDYTAGLYTMGKTTLAVSRGLGGSRRIPIRIANQPEIPVITLRAGETER